MPLLWILGLACGVILPLGVALVAIDLALVAWLNVAIGLYLGLRPGATTTPSSRTALALLVIFACHAPLIVGALASPRDLAQIDAFDPRLRWGLIAVALIIAGATAAIAWALTRRVLDRFEAWAGRPIAGPADRALKEA